MLSDKLDSFFSKFSSLNTDQIQKLVETYLSDEDLETMIEHLEEFYGIEDDEELGTLCQIMVTGYVAAKEIEKDAKDSLN